MTGQTMQVEICVVGGGAIGKAAALGLAQAGLRVALLRQPGELTSTLGETWDARVYALNQLARRLLSRLKVWDALDLARVAPITEMQVASGLSTTDGKLGFDAYGAHAEELAWIIEDRNLNQALDAALKFAPNLELVQGQAHSLHVDTHAAHVNLQDGRVISANLLVGADGAQSWVRAQWDIGYDYRAYQQQGVVANFECEQPHHGIARQWFIEGQGIIALLPLPENKVSLVWSAPDVLAAELMREPQSVLCERLAPYAEASLGRLSPILPEAIKAYPLRLLRPHQIVAPRTALLGDAAHVVHPLAGHGMNLGFADVCSLLDKLENRATQTECGDAALLHSYARSRKEDILLMQYTTDGLARLFASELAPVRGLRNLGMNLLNHLPIIKRKLIAHALGHK